MCNVWHRRSLQSTNLYTEASRNYKQIITGLCIGSFVGGNIQRVELLKLNSLNISKNKTSNTWQKSDKMSLILLMCETCWIEVQIIKHMHEAHEV